MENYCTYCMSPKPGDFCGFCGKRPDEYEPLPHHLCPGSVLGNKYVVGRVLGEGGFGITYIGIDQLLGLKLAIKEYFPTGLVNRNHTATSAVSVNLGDAQASFERGRSRFLQEAKTLAKFSGESGIVGIRDFFNENNTAYIVMDYLDGITLRDYLQKYGNLSFDAAVKLLTPVMNSLKKVHAQDLIHRDISPDNIMLMKDGQVKLLDFGAARNITGMDERSLSVMLKPGYAPEEQYRTKGRQGPWTDVYALSATIYRAITGRTPDASNDRAFVDELPLPSALGAVITPGQEQALMKGLAVLQKNRYQSVDELLNGFQQAAWDGDSSDATESDTPTPIGTDREVVTEAHEPHVPGTPRIKVSPAHATPHHDSSDTPASTPAHAEGPSDAGKVPGKEAPTPFGKKAARSLLVYLGVPLTLLAVFLLALGGFAYIDNHDSQNLLICLLALPPLIPGILMVFLYLRKQPKDQFSMPCRIMGIVALVPAVVCLGFCLRMPEVWSFYLIQFLLDLLIAYLLLRRGFTSHQARKRMHFVATVCGVLCVIAVIVTVVATTLTTVTIGDTRIRRSDTEASITLDQINMKQLEKLSTLTRLERLYINSSFLDDRAIEYIAKLSNLTTLSLYGNGDITDVSGLSSLTKLQTLNLSETSITDISVVEFMPQLTNLSIDGTAVSDLSSVSGLENLNNLSMSDLEQVDYSTLTLPATVRYLDLSYTGLTDLTLLDTVESLYSLDASGNQLTDVRPLEKFDTIDNLTLSDNNISALTGIPNSNSLYLSGNQLTDISPLANCTGLWQLYLANNEISDISPLENCPRLYSLDLENNQITDISALGFMDLTILNLAYNQVSDISPLSESVSMQFLYLEHNQVTDISCLNNMTNLSSLRCYDNQITDISPLLTTRLPQELTRLDLHANNITDISPLRQFQALSTVIISENPVEDLSPLADCTTLTNIQANETSVSDITCLSGMPNLINIEVIRTNVTDFSVSPVAGSDNNLYLYLSYSEALDLEAMDAARETGLRYRFYDVPEKKLRSVGNYGSCFTPDMTDLYLHPVEEILGTDEAETEP